MSQYRIPKRFSEALLNTVDPQQYQMIYSYAERLQQRILQGDGLMLCGPPGIGKTWALAGLTNHYTRVVPRADYIFITAPEFFDAYGVFRTDDESAWDNYRAQWISSTFESVPWLVLNDLGKEYRGGKLAEQMPHKLGKLLRARSERQRITHITTNLEPSVFKETYGESIASLLSETTSAFVVQGPDRRKGG